jgi:uncharacterized protein
MHTEGILQATERFVRDTLAGDGSGHDWWHVERVRQLALRIGRDEGADLLVVELAALLHDVADWKFHGGDEHAGARAAREWLASNGVAEPTIAHVCRIVADLSYKGAGVQTPMHSLEGRVVQDADRLDAIGAIGIARAFAYGGFKQREIHNPEGQPRLHSSFEEYKSSQSTTINHFHEKLLLLKDRMNTATGRRLAEERHAFMLRFLEKFGREWNGLE